MSATFTQSRATLLLYNHIDDHLRVERVVGDEEDAAATFEIGVVRIDGDFQFFALAGHDAALAQTHTDSGVVNLEGTDDEGRLTSVGKDEFAFGFLVLTERTDGDGRAVDLCHGSKSKLRGGVDEVGKKGDGDVDFRFLAHAVAHEATQVDVALRKTHGRHGIAVERDEHAAHAARANHFGVGLGGEVLGQVHEFGMVGFLAAVEDAEHVGGFVAAVHVVELNVVGAQIVVAHLEHIFLRGLRLRHSHLADDVEHVRHGVDVGVDGYAFVEMSEEFGVVRHADFPSSARFNAGLGPLGLGTSTVGAYVLDVNGGSALVGKRKVDGAGRLPKEGAEFLRLLFKLYTGLRAKLQTYHAYDPRGEYGYRFFYCNHEVCGICIGADARGSDELDEWWCDA